MEIDEEKEKEERNEKLKILINQFNIPAETIDQWLKKAEVEKLEDMKEEHVKKCIDYLENQK